MKRKSLIEHNLVIITIVSAVVAGIIFAVFYSKDKENTPPPPPPGGSPGGRPPPIPLTPPTPTPPTPPTPTPPTPPPPGGGGDTIPDNWTTLHNTRRLIAWDKPGDVNRLQWDTTLANQALEHSKKLYNEKNGECGFVEGDHGDTSGGQNLSCVNKGSTITPDFAITNKNYGWYDSECSKYKPGDKFTKDAGHYTQVVWKDAKKLGCGIYKNFATCNYDVGNINTTDDFLKNVPQNNNHCNL
jgi:hypothetical protein